MRKILAALITGLAVTGGALFLAAPSWALPPVAGHSIQFTGQEREPANASADKPLGSQSTPSPTQSASPLQTPSPTNPVNPGTGEAPEAEATRTDYAPYVIAGVALVTLVTAYLWRRSRRNKPIV